jgi:hypothetical protein
MKPGELSLVKDETNKRNAGNWTQSGWSLKPTLHYRDASLQPDSSVHLFICQTSFLLGITRFLDFAHRSVF